MDKITIILDTNVFDSANYNFQTGSLKYLEEYIAQGKMDLWIHNISVNEAKRHIKAKLFDFIQTIRGNKIFKNTLLLEQKYRDVFASMEEESVVEDGVKAFDDYLTRTKARILNNTCVNIDDILSDYFSQKPPFGSGKKKSEFPDAIMISSIKNELNSVDELHIVSDDDDWRKSFENERKVSVYKTLKDFLDFYNRQNEIRNAVARYFDNQEVAEKLSTYVKNILDSRSFDVEGQFADDDHLVYNQFCEEITSQFTKQFECGSLYVEYIDPMISQNDSIEETEGVVKVQMDSFATIELECGYFDSENSTWDPEEREYIHRDRNYLIESHGIEFTTIVNLKAKVRKDKDPCFNIDDIQIEDVPQRLNFQTLLCIGDETNETFKIEKVYKCPICSKATRLELIESACGTSSHERQMGEEIEYSIEYESTCENCLNGYKITGSIFEYPRNVLNLDDTQIEWEKTSPDKA